MIKLISNNDVGKTRKQIRCVELVAWRCWTQMWMGVEKHSHDIMMTTPVDRYIANAEESKPGKKILGMCYFPLQSLIHDLAFLRSFLDWWCQQQQGKCKFCIVERREEDGINQNNKQKCSTGITAEASSSTSDTRHSSSECGKKTKSPDDMKMK